MAESKQQQIFDVKKVEVTETKSYVLAKRIMDISLSAIGLGLLLPVFLLIAFLIKLEDRKGSIIFKQKRIGENGKHFHMYKFRSMVWNAEELLDKLQTQNEASGPLFKIKDDPRVTKIGKFIRKTSIDELPQLINVLRGEMSLVGPRPALPREVAEYNSYEKLRLSVKPGLTCFWQVQGRSNLTFEEQVELDLKYIRKRNIKLDVVLILKTVKVLLGSKDAY